VLILVHEQYPAGVSAPGSQIGQCQDSPYSGPRSDTLALLQILNVTKRCTSHLLTTIYSFGSCTKSPSLANPYLSLSSKKGLDQLAELILRGRACPRLVSSARSG
jgi:hypothetical protein